MNAHKLLLQRVSEKRILLTITAGRTGTKYLHSLFSLLPDVYSVHEGEPDYKHLLRRIQTQPSASTQFLLEHKLPAILACPTGTYAETSHLFCKGFLEPLLNLGIRPDLVLLRRPPRKVACSCLERLTVPARTALGTSYLVSPADPNTLPLPAWETLSDYQLCFWYALEIERRQARYRHWYAQLGGRFFDVTAAELNDPETFLSMADAFGLETGNRQALTERHSQTTAIAHNKNPMALSASFDFDAAEDAVWDSISYYEPLLRRQLAERYGEEHAGT
jgi:hypothetical protein